MAWPGVARLDCAYVFPGMWIPLVIDPFAVYNTFPVAQIDALKLAEGCPYGVYWEYLRILCRP